MSDNLLVGARLRTVEFSADSGGWGWAAFEYDAASDTFKPRNESENPPQGHDAKCGFACHSVVQNRDYVFTEYGHR